jgi:hypothetical protein
MGNDKLVVRDEIYCVSDVDRDGGSRRAKNQEIKK